MKKISMATCSLMLGCGVGADGRLGSEDGAETQQDTQGLSVDAQPAAPRDVARMRNAINRRGLQPVAPAPFVSRELFVLGQALSFDKILSGDRDVSCMTCHHPDTGSDDDRALPLGVGGTGLGVHRTGGEVVPRNAPALFNLHAFERMFWDGRIEESGSGELTTPAGDQLTAEMVDTFTYGMVSAQAMFPVTSREEMRGTDNELASLADDDFSGIWSALMRRLGEVEEYVALFEAAYPGETFGEMTFAHAANAIAGFELSGFEAVGSPWNEFLSGDDSALGDVELSGMQAFFESGCGNCHSGAGLSDFEFHNTGLVQFGPGKGHGPDGDDDYGRGGVTGSPGDRYEFRTPPLFNVELTAPYGHAGQFADLGEFVAHYRNPRQNLAQYRMQEHVAEPDLFATLLDNRDEIGANLSRRLRNDGARRRVGDIVAFLRALTDDATRDLSTLVPDRVPSGLPVQD